MITLGTALEAFIREHEYCGELETGQEGSHVDGVHLRGRRWFRPIND